MQTVYHGTSHGFKVEIEDHGLRARPGLSKGTRISLMKDLALVHASAWCAYIMLTEQLPPKALIAKATIDSRRIRESADKNPLADLGRLRLPGLPFAGSEVVGPALVVPGGLTAAEITLEEVDLPFLYGAEPARRALAIWERMTDNKITMAPPGRRTGG